MTRAIRVGDRVAIADPYVGEDQDDRWVLGVVIGRDGELVRVRWDDGLSDLWHHLRLRLVES